MFDQLLSVCSVRVTKEYHLGEGKRVDLLAQHKERKILIEIDTDKSDGQANIAKCAGTAPWSFSLRAGQRGIPLACPMTRWR
jgi:hypothetical protein